MYKHAVILAGGLGTRLQPYTAIIPKPLVPVGQYPILEIVIRQLAKQHFNRITLAVNHHAQLIQAFFGNGQQWNIAIDYSIEQQPMGTIGPLKLIKNCPEHFLVMNGDILTDFDYQHFYQIHQQNEHDMTIACCQREQQSEFGLLEVKDNKLIGFKEKPITYSLVSMGIYMLRKSVLQWVPAHISFGFDQLILKLLRIDKPPHTFLHHGLWLDIGRPEDYAEANKIFAAKNSYLLA